MRTRPTRQTGLGIGNWELGDQAVPQPPILFHCWRQYKAVSFMVNTQTEYFKKNVAVARNKRVVNTY